MYLGHVTAAISSPNQDGRLDASSLQSAVVGDPVVKTVNAFTCFTEEDPS